MTSSWTTGPAVSLIRLAAVGVLATGVVAGVADAESAPTGRSLVVLGDSYTANPPCDGLLTKCVDTDGTGPRACLHGPSSWPAQLSTLMALDPEDVENNSCSSATIDTGPVTSTGQEVPGRGGYTLAQEALAAAKDGAFGPRTRVVAIQLGFNDAWPRDSTVTADASRVVTCVFDILEGCDENAVAQGRWPDVDAITGSAYAERIRKVVDYVKYYAPNARIELVGYPEVAPEGDSVWCFDLFGLGNWVQPRARAMVEFWDRLQTAEREAAGLLGIDFVDVRPATAGHGLCSNDPWFNGLLDPRPDHSGLPLHPSAHGDAAVAATVYHHVAQPN
ncbi:SGNH/GDSL hydrolase family protein [Nocardia sp. CDC153]|uniref:SGNH/GDSL hydrolase family protein n=1 Tax=Nocardia sp. CDC153 TaxID=3112167 RepID=UPI002DB69465|nr:SGNH/GDSL hydrolase family protein [Nocardia sp. CDC153]MEC3957035.1 SGNH/GDSL hydrolase family protein [Nocardia sp. CDC153]